MKWLQKLSVAFLLPILCFGQGRTTIPDKIQHQLNREFPSWHLLENRRLLAELASPDFDSTLACANLVWGDFDGNRKRDYALFLERIDTSAGKQQMLIAFLGYGHSFRKYVLDSVSFPVYIAELIWIAPKGRELYDFEAEKNFRLKNDGIDAIVIGKGTRTYVFEKGEFKSVITGD